LDEDDAPVDAEDPCQLIVDPPMCETCARESARGKVVGRPQGGPAICKWLCKECFVASWGVIAADDGRWQTRPQWLLRGPSGELRDATPPQMQRYANLRHCSPKLGRTMTW
jgi:hypothetical protein